MLTSMFRCSLLLVLSLGLGSCKEGSTAANAETPTRPPVSTPLAPLKVMMDVPPAAQVSKAPLGDEVEVRFAKGHIIVGTSPIYQTAQEAQQYLTERAGAVYSTPKEFKSESLGAGFIASYHTTGSLGTEYAVVSKLIVDGTAYRCDAQVPTREAQRSALAACRSLRK